MKHLIEVSLFFCFFLFFPQSPVYYSFNASLISSYDKVLKKKKKWSECRLLQRTVKLDSTSCHLGNVEGQTLKESQFILMARCALDGRREGLWSRSKLALCCWNENARQGAVAGCAGVNVVELRTNLPQPIQQWGFGVALSRCSSLPKKTLPKQNPSWAWGKK